MRRIRSLVGVILISALVAPFGAGAPLPAGAATSGGYTATKTVTRDELTPDGVTQTLDSQNVTLNVSQVTNLQGLQEIQVSWTGAHPTGGSAPDPNGPQGTSLPWQTEYPMVLLECRGVDSPTAPANQQLSPTTCWTAYNGENGERNDQFGGNPAYSAYPDWRLDMYASAAQRGPVVGVPDPSTVITSPSGATTTAGALLASTNCAGQFLPALFPEQYWVPFVAADGTTYYPDSCQNGLGASTFPSPPEAALNGSGINQSLSFPSNETYAKTGQDGSGRSNFDVFTTAENASLGCSDTVPCALVAIPIMGMSCDLADLGVPAADRPSATATVVSAIASSHPTTTQLQDADANCSTSGFLGAGSSGTGGGVQDDAVLGSLWWAASNWRNRITAPLTFAPVQDPCASHSTSGQELDIYGSELMQQATAQWDPHFCTDPSLFTLKHVVFGEGPARRTVASGQTKAAYAAYAPTGTYTSPVVSAPTAITGFAIAFTIDGNNGEEAVSLNLDARLLAKLLTESYPDAPVVAANDTGCALPVPATATVAPPCRVGALSQNPINILQDPEFQALNPSLYTLPSTGGSVNLDSTWRSRFDPGATLYALSTDSDVMYALTSYIINDPEAHAWLEGHPDPWGMVVNPAYNLSAPQYEMPTSEWPLLDQYDGPVPNSGGTAPIVCPDGATTPYLDLVATPSQAMSLIAQTVEFAHPLSTLQCLALSTTQGGSQGQQISFMSRDPVQGIGSRFVLGLVSVAQAQQLQLHTASLETQVTGSTPAGQFAPATDRTFVAPSNASLEAAAKLLRPDPTTGTWQIPAGSFATPAGAGAYPGTMLVNTEVPTTGLSSSDSTNIAKFLRFAAGPGQMPGTGFGQLPAGYLPMTAANGMGALAAYTQAAADDVASQNGQVPPLTNLQGGGGGSAAGGGGHGVLSVSPTPTPSGAVRNPTATAAAGTGKGTTGGGTSTGSLSLPGGGGQASAVAPPVAGPATGLTAALGKTLRIISSVAQSLARWLVLIVVVSLLLAAALYVGFGRRWRTFNPTKLMGNLREVLAGLLARRRTS